MAAANPAAAEQMRAMMSDPARLRALTDPRTQAAMRQMAQVQGVAGGEAGHGMLLGDTGGRF